MYRPIITYFSFDIHSNVIESKVYIDELMRLTSLLVTNWHDNKGKYYEFLIYNSQVFDFHVYSIFDCDWSLEL
jgi:hypothetical protein